MPELRFLALGDSYTIGEGVAYESRWPVQLVRRLEADFHEPEFIAVTGWTTDELSAGIDQEDPRGPFQLVSLLIGANNQYRSRELLEYRDQFSSLLNRAIQYAGGNASHVFVVSVPDWSVTPYPDKRDRGQISAEIDQFNAEARSVAESLNVAFVDITSVSKTQGQMVVSDGLHPNEEAYSAWVDLIEPVVRNLIGNVDSDVN